MESLTHLNRQVLKLPTRMTDYGKSNVITTETQTTDVTNMGKLCLGGRAETIMLQLEIQPW